jgi:hypothetical protein
MTAGEKVLPEVTEFENACAAAVASYKKFMCEGVKKYCTVTRKDLQVVKKLANDLRKKALDARTALKTVEGAKPA